MSNHTSHANERGYSEDEQFYSCESGMGDSICIGWRNTRDRRVWSLTAYGSSLGLVTKNDTLRAVMDDFGNLRRVPA